MSVEVYVRLDGARYAEFAFNPEGRRRWLDDDGQPAPGSLRVALDGLVGALLDDRSGPRTAGNAEAVAAFEAVLAG